MTDDERDIEIERLRDENAELLASVKQTDRTQSLVYHAFTGMFAIGTLGAGIGRAWGALGQYWGGWVGMAAGALLGQWCKERVRGDWHDYAEIVEVAE